MRRTIAQIGINERFRQLREEAQLGRNAEELQRNNLELRIRLRQLETENYDLRKQINAQPRQITKLNCLVLLLLSFIGGVLLFKKLLD